MQLNPEQWTHLEIVGTCVVPILLFWWDTKRSSAKQHREDGERNARQHKENSDRLIKIETMLDPVWKWWLTRSGDD